MNDQVSIAHDHLYGTEGSLCQRKDMLDHLGDHPRPARASTVGKGLRQLVRVAFDRVKLQAIGLDEQRKRRWSGQPDGVPGVLQPNSQRNERLDVTARAVRQDCDAPIVGHFYGCGTHRAFLSRSF
jgi:hypothetical protein